MKTTSVRIDPREPGSLPPGRVDYALLDQTTEADLARQQRDDDEEAIQETARFARRVRRRLGLTQVEFARRDPGAARDDPELGTGEALPDRRREGVVAAA